jgi:hypothetical protein
MIVFDPTRIMPSSQETTAAAITVFLTPAKRLL